MQPGIAAIQRVWGNRPKPPANTIVYVPELVPADFLVAIEAIAVIAMPCCDYLGGPGVEW